MKSSNYTGKFIILSLTLLAFLLRAYRLDFQSYWIDEGWTVYFARQSLAELWHLLQLLEPKPPFYFPSMIYWMKLVGDSEYALRFYSVTFGVLAVPFTYRLGQALGRQRLGLLLALLLTVSPYQIWHAQDARMYSLLTAAAAMSMWGFVKIWQGGGLRSGALFMAHHKGLNRGWRWWLVYLVGTEWALMVHYHGLILIGVQGLFLLLTWRQHWRGYLRWAASLGVIFLLYLPWLVFGGNLLQGYVHWVPQPTLGDTYLRSAIAYSVGEMMPRTQALPLTLVFVVVYMLGLCCAARRPWRAWAGREMLAFLVAYTIVPNFAAWLYGEFKTTAYLERYMIVTQLGYLLTIAIGLAAIADKLPDLSSMLKKQLLPRFPLSSAQFLLPSLLALLRVLPLLCLVGINGWVLYHHYFDPLYAKENWRDVVKTIENFGQPGDAVLLTGDGGENLFDFYYHGHLPVYASFNLLPLTHPDYKKGRPGIDKMDDILTDLTTRYRRLWYTPYGSDIDVRIEKWLAEQTYPAWHSWVGRKRLALYATQPVTDRLEPLHIGFSDQGPTLVSAALPQLPTPAGDLLPLTLIWQTAAPLTRDYQLSLRLLNTRGDVFTQSDWPPLTAASPTSTWPVNQSIPDHRSLWLPADLPPGDYTLHLVVYDPASGQSLGQPVTISGIRVGPAQVSPPLTALSIPNSTRQTVGALTLVGYAVPDKIRPGQEMWLWLYWQATSTVPAQATLRLSLGDAAADFPLIDSVGPLDSWSPGQVRRAIYHLPTSPRLPGQNAPLKIAFMSTSGQIDTEITLTQVNLETRPRQFQPPTITHPLDLTLGQVKLMGYDLPNPRLAPGDALPVTFYWQAGAEMNVDYTVFVQLLSSAGQVVAQRDLPPQAGAAPTTTWLPGEIVTDPYTLSLPADLQPGSYRLITGLYNAATGQRLPASSGGDFVELLAITVK